MIPIVVPQDWDAIRERPPSRASSASHQPRCNPCTACFRGCTACCRSCARSSAQGCVGCASCARELRAQGWRTWCLFGINSFLVLLVVLNFGITLWLMTVMKFTNAGLGKLKIVPNGVQLNGKAYIMDSLVASTIASKDDKPITFESYDNFTIVITDSMKKKQNRLFIDENQFLSQTKNFILEDDSGKVIFSSSPEVVAIGADMMRVVGTGGAIFDRSIETPLVSSEPGNDLTLESLTRSLKIEAASKIAIDSSGGSIEANSLKDIKLRSKKGTIKLQSKSIVLDNLQTAQSLQDGWNRTPGKTKIYQLCVCENGRLFLASPKGICEIHEAELLCKY